jgi:hypothetical protein
VRSKFLTAAVCSALGALPAIAGAQAQPAALPVVSSPSQSPGTLSQQQLDQLLAPVALYPDQVLTDVLAASTYPAQVVEAERFVSDPSHAGMDGAALTDTAAGEDWDPSVKALLMFPQVLQMMDSNLDWTEHLGRAFMAQQADVMAAVQQLRLEAEQAGTLASGPYDSVVNEGGDISINPASQQDVYLPNYQAQCVFGPDPACDGLDNQVFWATDFFLPYGYAQWGYLDWPRREIRLGHDSHGGDPFPGVWHHAGVRIASFGAGVTGNTGHFNYAPPANAPFGHGGGFAPRFSAPARFNPSSGFRASPQRAPAFHPAPAISGVHAPAGIGHR